MYEHSLIHRHQTHIYNIEIRLVVLLPHECLSDVAFPRRYSFGTFSVLSLAITLFIFVFLRCFCQVVKQNDSSENWNKQTQSIDLLYVLKREKRKREREENATIHITHTNQVSVLVRRSQRHWHFKSSWIKLRNVALRRCHRGLNSLAVQFHLNVYWIAYRNRNTYTTARPRK